MQRQPTGDAKMGARVKAARDAAGLSQEELARRVGIEQPSLSQIETGSVMPGQETLHSIADELGVSLDYLRGRKAMALEFETFEQDLLEAMTKKQKRQLKQLDDEQRKALAGDLAAFLEARLSRIEPKPRESD